MCMCVSPTHTCTPGALQTHWIFGTKIIYLISISLALTPTPLRSPLLSSQVNYLFFNYHCYIYVYLHTTYRSSQCCSYVHVFRTEHMRLHSLPRAHPQRKRSLPVSAVIDYLQFFIQGWDLVRLSLPMLVFLLITWVFFSQPYCCSFTVMFDKTLSYSRHPCSLALRIFPSPLSPIFSEFKIQQLLFK